MALLFTGLTKHSSNFTGSETAANPNPNNVASITLTAQWRANCNDGISSIGESKTFNYTGSTQTFNACAGRTYKLEVWGAQGGNASGGSYYVTSNFRGGYGGYAVGNYSPSEDTKLYIYVGGQGQSTYGANTMYGGWNGGGGVIKPSGQNTCSNHPGASGGGATDITTTYSDVSTDSYYRYKRSTESYTGRIIVAGGGGGNGIYPKNVGGNGGGIIGSTGTNNDQEYANGGTQTSGGESTTSNQENTISAPSALGLGASGQVKGGCGCEMSPGAGGGYYGGGSRHDCNQGAIGAGGSGYIGGVSGSTSERYMVIFNDTNYYGTATSTATRTYTKTTDNVNSTAISGYAKSGNGYARITYLGT